MRLSDLERFDPITIQCHDNPDADSLAAGYGLYCYFQEKGKQVRLIYSGRNEIHKSNLRLMVDNLAIPVEYVPVRPGDDAKTKGLLITVDCQYGAGNVTRLKADHVAIIDHHQQEIEGVELAEIKPNLGSCATLVWKMLSDEGYVISDDNHLGTALYYGLYTDTNQFSELFNPLDMDMREAVPFDKSAITLFRNSNISLSELEIAGVAMIKASYNDDYEFAVIHAKPCDSNILGLISDFLLQVDVIKTCVVYNQTPDGEGFKFSVRSCVREVNASELASYLAEGIGSGGGHYEKAGGFISMKRYEQMFPTLHSEGYFNNRMTSYFDNCEIIRSDQEEADISEMKLYAKKRIPVSFVRADEVLPIGTPITIRTLEGDLDMTVEEDLYILIGIRGEVYPNRAEDFLRNYELVADGKDCERSSVKTEYIPRIKNREDGRSLVITDYAKLCVPREDVFVYAKPLEKRTKVFTLWSKDRYMLGRPGDYLAVRKHNKQDVSVIEKSVFDETYYEVTNE